MKKRTLSRRTFLRGTVAGAAVALALPPLDAMLRSSGAMADGSDELPFFGLFYWANGLPWHAAHGQEQLIQGHPDLWTPATTGAGFDPSFLLTPLARHNVNVATGLEPHTEILPQPPGQGDGHMRGFMVALTGDRPRPEDFNHGSHTLTALRPSIDQFIAHHPDFYSESVRFRSLEVGVSQARFHDYGHWNGISYNGPNSINLPIQSPGQLYDRLFSAPPDAASVFRRSKLLDAVLEDAQSLRARLGARDRVRLEEHLDHIQTLQNRTELMIQSCEAPPRPTDSGDLIEKTETMAQLLATAVNCGLTRVFSFMLTSPASTHVFNNIGVPDGMHKTCHDGHWERVRDISLYQMQAFDSFLNAFAVEGPTGTPLLDRACILGTSEYGEGWKHSVKELPVVLAGGACGKLRSNVHTRESGGNLCKAHMTVLRALGLNDESFGFNGAQTSEPISGFLS
jgi:hypothetical protein